MFTCAVVYLLHRAAALIAGRDHVEEEVIIAEDEEQLETNEVVIEDE